MFTRWGVRVSLLDSYSSTLHGIFQSPQTEVKHLADFLEISCSNNLARDISAQCSFSIMKKDKDPLEDMAEWKNGEPGMYRKGNGE